MWCYTITSDVTILVGKSCTHLHPRRACFVVSLGLLKSPGARLVRVILYRRAHRTLRHIYKTFEADRNEVFAATTLIFAAISVEVCSGVISMYPPCRPPPPEPASLQEKRSLFLRCCGVHQ